MPFSVRAAARRWPAWAGLALLGTLPLATSAQTPPDTQPLDWRQANDTVGRFLRGHLDLIKGEPAATSEPAPGGPLLDLNTARQRALAQHPELFERADSGPAQALALRRERQALAMQVTVAWSQALRADQALALALRQQDAAESGAELARRMLQVGHFSRAQWLREHGSALQARLAADRARQETVGARDSLARLWNASAPGPWTWPEPWPALPPVAGDDESLQTQALQSHTATSLARLQAQRARAALPPATWAAARQTLDRLAAQAIASPNAPAILPTQAPPCNPELEQALAAEQAARSSESTVRSQLREALALWRLRQAQLGTLERIAQAQDELVADSQRRYNGMLQSTWELLARVREQLAAQEAVQATRHALWLAHLQVLHLLAGGDPLPGLGGTPAPRTPDAPSFAGH